jgi:hypothetical protein
MLLGVCGREGGRREMTGLLLVLGLEVVVAAGLSSVVGILGVGLGADNVDDEKADKASW